MIAQIGRRYSRGGKSRYDALVTIGPGWDAFNEGVPLRACPHPWGSEEANNWRYGWKWAWHDWKRHRKGQRMYGNYDAWPVDLPSSRHKIKA
jgi:hypothetical protein